MAIRTVNHVWIGQSQAEGQTVGEYRQSYYCRTSDSSRRLHTWTMGLADWAFEEYGMYFEQFNLAVGSSGVNPGIGDGFCWHPTPDNGETDQSILVDQHPDLATGVSALDMMVALNATHCSVCWLNTDANDGVSAEDFETYLGDVISTIQASIPAMKFMIHLACGDISAPKTEIYDGWVSYCANNVDNALIFQGMDMYHNVDTQLRGGSPHPTLEGYYAIERRLRPYYQQSGWF